jgi:hypothetical protein
VKNCLPLNASFSTNSKTDAGRDLPVATVVKVEGNSQMTYCSVHFPAIFILLNVHTQAGRKLLMERMKMPVDFVHRLVKTYHICYMNARFRYEYVMSFVV